MLSFTHSIVSLPFALYLTNPLLIFITAFIWHLFCDTLLHWNIYYDRLSRNSALIICIDVAAGLGAIWFLIGPDAITLPIVAAVAGGNAPDILHGILDILPTGLRRKILKFIQPWFRFHDKIQLETDNIWTGLVWQLILVSLAIFLISK